MEPLEILSILATFAGVACFSVVFTILYQSYVQSTIKQVESGKRDIELIDEALSEKSAKGKRKKKIGSIIRTVVFVLFLLLIIPLFLFSLINRIADGKPIFGKTVMVVASGSMSEKNTANDYLITNNLDNQFQKYDIIILEKVNSVSDLNKYDVIAFKNNDGINVIHRIIDIVGSGENTKFTTRGDANNKSDDYKPNFSDVLGVYRGKKIGAVGIIIMFLQSYSGIITIIALLYCLFMIDFVSRKIEKCENKRLGQLLSAIESDENTAKSMRAEFKETIYYRGFAYRFDENGFIDKTEITGEQPEKDTMVKVFGDGTESQKILIETREDDGKDA